jgi:hypothetical protein
VLTATVAISRPADGVSFAAGETPVLTIAYSNGCVTVPVSSLLSANLYLYGPRLGDLTRTDCTLLNCIPLYALPDGGPIPGNQHHYINLKSPLYADPTQANLTAAPDGTITYQLGAVSDEIPGTYTVAVAGATLDDVGQVFQLADFQIGAGGSPTVGSEFGATLDQYWGDGGAETYASGPTSSSSCYSCHLGSMSGKSYEHHIIPSNPAQPYGSYARDQFPIGSCKACHNMGGYSQTPIVRVVHGLHRGVHQLQPGVAHPDWGYPTGAYDALAGFTDVLFPSAQYQSSFQTVDYGDGNEVNERDCAACHADNRWKTNPTRVSCGSCHDNLWFADGTLPDGGIALAGSLTPPRVVGPPAAGPCVQNSDCSTVLIFGLATQCNVQTGNCELHAHGGGPQADDSKCSTCHTADFGTASVPSIAEAHEIFSQTQSTGLQITNPTMTGNSQVDADGGLVFLAGDTPTLTFTLSNDAGPNTDFLTNTAYSATVVVGGPTTDRQRLAYYVLAPPSRATPGGTLTAGATPGTYSYVFPAPLPAVPQAPFDQQFPIRATNPPGTYTMWLWIAQSLTSVAGPTHGSTPGVAFKDVGNWVQDFEFGAPGPILPRQVILKSACNSCHASFAHHGGQRTETEQCSLCHTSGSVDGAVGLVAPTSGNTNDCQGLPGVWLCYVPYPTRAPTGGSGAACSMAVDPTPGPPIYFTKAVGQKGPACTAATAATDCAGVASGWEGCFQSFYSTTSNVPCNAGSLGCACYITADPIPGQPVDFAVFVHDIHFARLRAGYAESNNLVNPGLLTEVGPTGGVDDYSKILFPQDIRNCTMCHASTNAPCSPGSPCGVGQTCFSPKTIGVATTGTCVNTAWQVPSAMVCTSCHDSESAFAHVAVNTYPNPAGGPPLESCTTCHGPNPDVTVGSAPDFSVAAVHNITNPYVPPYDREPATPTP